MAEWDQHGSTKVQQPDSKRSQEVQEQPSSLSHRGSI
jgi:hypothetical protein